jgi:hypothetical protein
MKFETEKQDERALREVVEMCWRVAENADLPGSPLSMYIDDSKSNFNSARWSIFQILLQTQTMMKNMKMSVEGPTEPWQED